MEQMLEESPHESFNINSFLSNTHRLVERMKEKTEWHFSKNYVMSKKECRRLYPHNDGLDGEMFYELILQFRNRHFVEKLISVCGCDFSLAHRLGTLCHGNIFFFEKLRVLFSNDLSRACHFLNSFSSSSSLSSPFLLASQFLSRFDNDVSSASSFLSRFNGDVSSASSFLSHFSNVSEAEKTLEQNSAKFSEESSFKLALSGCNGDISVVEAFSRSSGIKHLELLYDSEKHPRNAKEFHSRCDIQGPSVSFVCSNGNCVCGVVKSSWITPLNPDDQCVTDSSAYLLCLSPNPQKYPIKSDSIDRALYCHSSRGPSFGIGDFATSFTTDEKYPKGMCGWVRSGCSYDLPENAFLFPTTDTESYPIDRIVVCKYTQ